MKAFFIPVLILFAISACKNDNSNSENNNSNPSDSISEVIKGPVSETEMSDFEEVDIDAFNEKLAKENKSMNPEEILSFYYPAVIPENDDSNQKIDVSSRVEGEHTIVTLVHDNQPHIVIQGHRLVMTLTKNDDKWIVLGLKQQFKCWLRKDNVVWSTDKCS
jgi:Icc-related predicted phosphoesterase